MRRFAVLLAAAISIAACAGPSEQATESLGGRDSGVPAPAGAAATGAEPGALADRLRAGGLAIVVRHGHTDAAQDADPIDVADCSTQRNLSERGRSESEAMGAAIRELDIPIGDVLSSVYCRAMDTGQLAFGRVEAADEIDGRAVWPPDAAKRTLAGERLGNLIRARLPAAGDRNTVMIVHQLFPDALDGTVLGEGEAVVYALVGDRIENLAPSSQASGPASGERRAQSALRTPRRCHGGLGGSGMRERAAAGGAARDQRAGRAGAQRRGER